MVHRNILACATMLLLSSCSWLDAEPVAEAEAPPASQSCTGDCTTHCTVDPGGTCGCTQTCETDHDRTMTCDAATCVCMLDDREVFAFPVDRTCASTATATDAFVDRCGAEPGATAP